LWGSAAAVGADAAAELLAAVDDTERRNEDVVALIGGGCMFTGQCIECSAGLSLQRVDCRTECVGAMAAMKKTDLRDCGHNVERRNTTRQEQAEQAEGRASAQAASDEL
jgi:hypothetical protein